MAELTNIHHEANVSTSSKSPLIIDIKEMLRTPEPPRSSEPCIYRVPDQLRNLNQEAYTPQVISVGPYHHGKERHKSMEKFKVKCLKNFWIQTQLNVEDLVNIIMELEESIRDCYAEDIKYGSDDFVKIILVDASFIIEFVTESRSIRPLDPWLRYTIINDLILLENQLPLFVIDKLYNLLRASSSINFPLNWFGPYNINILPVTSGLVTKHFLDLLNTSLRPESQRPRGENNEKSCAGILKRIREVKLCIHWLQKRSNEEDKHLERGTQSHKADNQFHDESQNFPSVTQLQNAGVKLEASSNECMLKFEFINGVLKIPKLRITDVTEPYFRNIMAFEQRHYIDNAYVTNYALLLDSLINNTEDVDLLVEKGIIVNWIGDNNRVTTLVNNLGINIMCARETEEYYKLSQQLNKFYNNRCHRWRAILVRDYFSTPWSTASTSAAIILLVLTFIQTVCSLLDLKHR